MINKLMILVLCFGTFLTTKASEDDILFHVDKTPVKVSEFEYIYNKNNFDNRADYSENSLREYLDLYINFRLKVKEAEALELDKDPKLQSELKVYQEQLYNSFYDKDILRGLLAETKERAKEDISISHIYVKVAQNATKADENKAKQKIQSAYEALKNGMTFEAAAKKFSEDRYSKDKSGDIGFFTTLQISFYSFENAAYETPVGSFSEPIKTSIGYHIVKPNSKRPARGLVKASIIKLYKSKEAAKNAEVKTKIELLHQQLKGGADFAALAKTSSEDNLTKSKGGELDWFSIAQFDPIFEDKTFSLKNLGDFTEPFETANAWYIVKLLDKKPSYDSSEKLISEIKKSDRYTLARNEHIKTVQKKHDLTVNKTALNNFKFIAINQFKSKKHKFDIPNPSIIMQIADDNYTDADFGDFITSNAQKYRKLIAEVKFNRLFEDFKNDKTLAFHIIEYGKENKEYGSLLNEYRDGILLFDLMEKKVWSKAVEDTVGLKDYYINNKSKFVSKEKAEVKKYKATNSKSAKFLTKVLKKDPNLQNVKFLKKLEKKGISSSSEKLLVEKTDALTKRLIWEANSVNAVPIDDKFEIYHVSKILPAKERSFGESKGFAIAGYQDYLEKEWLKELHQKYKVTIDEAVLKGLIK